MEVQNKDNQFGAWMRANGSSSFSNISARKGSVNQEEAQREESNKDMANTKPTERSMKEFVEGNDEIEVQQIIIDTCKEGISQMLENRKKKKEGKFRRRIPAQRRPLSDVSNNSPLIEWMGKRKSIVSLDYDEMLIKDGLE
ncbi:hypothetical protein ACH5RR_040716 [Cinchona calisaya]|uniref:Uncharacterized protein n=1 Tax=Cinchona calisaya TaxID=153742 RepID=A0ABD2XSA5_9GENT